MAKSTPDEQLLAVAGTLEPPWALLEDGAASGTRLLVWDAAERFRVDWSDPTIGSLPDFAPGGGWFGAIAYDLGLPPGSRRRGPMIEQPLVDLFRPRQRIVLRPLLEPQFVGRDAERLWRSQAKGGRSRETEVGDRAGAEGQGGPSHTSNPLSPQDFSLPSTSFSQLAFEEAVRKALEYIRSGDIYQVNLSVAQLVALREPPFAVYHRLRALNPSPWMGYADFGDWQLVCGSPELLVELKDGLARARPIAGTRKKTGDAASDDAMRRELRTDRKEAAEHVMLVDLARNDLGRVAEYGSVRVAELGRIEEYSHVMHLVSDVEARLAAGTEPLALFRALFPGGTITGTPKIRAMEIIAELEPVARGMYTGALGWWDGGAGQWNILIRSAVVRGDRAVIQAGAGIVADSDPAREWKESLRKAAALRAAFGAAS